MTFRAENTARTRAESAREYYENAANREWPRDLGMTTPPPKKKLLGGFIVIYITEKFSDSLFVVFSSGRGERI